MYIVIGAQNNAVKNNPNIVFKDPSIPFVVDKYIKANKASGGSILGYRIQLYFGSDRAMARDEKAKFVLKHPDVSSYEKYDQPNFKIRVGDFRTKLEAHKFLKQLSSDFSGAFIVQDEVMPKNGN